MMLRNLNWYGVEWNMEYFIGLIGVEEIEGECNEYILDLSDDLWEGLAHCKKYNQFPWDIVEWLLGSGIQFSLKAYTCLLYTSPSPRD